jgi:hypothetical protein
MKLLHELGFILDFEMKYIIIYPQWLSNVFKSIVSLKNSNQIKDGIISRNQIFNNLQRELNLKNQESKNKNLLAKISHNSEDENKETENNNSVSFNINSIILPNVVL